jgi:uncharacterized protein YcbK (DUF882 family)
MTVFQHWQEVPESYWKWPSFTPREFACKSDGSLIVEPEFMERLQLLRFDLGFPFIINSGYRTPAYNAAVSKTGLMGPHTTGRAVDIRVYGGRAFDLGDAAKAYGFTGKGEKGHGPHEGRFIHLDDLPDAPGRPRPWSWTYP